MKLRELDATFVRETQTGTHDVTTLEAAQGITFTCPKCRDHSVLIWFRGCSVSLAAPHGDKSWKASGTGLDDLSLTPSINLPGPGCGWHGFVKNGDAS